MSGAERLCTPVSVRALTLALRQLYTHLLRRMLVHGEPDVTGTIDNLREFLEFLSETAPTIYTDAGVRELLACRALFDVNRLYRPSRTCNQKQFEMERTRAEVLWQELINLAAAALADLENNRCP